MLTSADVRQDVSLTFVDYNKPRVGNIVNSENPIVVCSGASLLQYIRCFSSKS